MWAFHFQKWTQENHQGQWVFSIQESAYKYSDVTFQTANKSSNAILVAWFHLIQNVIFKFKPTLHLRCSDISQILVKICQKKKKKKSFKPSSFNPIYVTNVNMSEIFTGPFLPSLVNPNCADFYLNYWILPATARKMNVLQHGMCKIKTKGGKNAQNNLIITVCLDSCYRGRGGFATHHWLVFTIFETSQQFYKVWQDKPMLICCIKAKQICALRDIGAIR